MNYKLINNKTFIDTHLISLGKVRKVLDVILDSNRDAIRDTNKMELFDPFKYQDLLF